VDSFRFYLAKDPFGGDINFNEEALLAVHNNELADVLVRAAAAASCLLL
jgi:methionyl-tRNA synthetase